MAIYGIFGGLGSGKTALAVGFLKKWQSEGHFIISNAKLNFDSYYISMEEMIYKSKFETDFFMNKVLFIDELPLIMESRRSNASINVDFTQNLLIQLGKLDCRFIYTAQLLSQVDLRIREFTKYFMWCTKTDIQGCPVYDDLRITKSDILIQVEMLIIRNDLKVETKKFTYNPKDIYKYYNTREIITLDREQYLK